MKKQNAKKGMDTGITLIALVVTIIILIILATISVNILVMDNGLLKRATGTSELTKDVTEDERVKLAVADALITGAGKLSTENVRNALKSEFGEEKVTDETFKGEGPWTFKGERKDYKIDGNGKIENYVPPVEPTDVYVALYENGTLTFSSKQDNLTEGIKYGNIKDEEYTSYSKRPWHSDKDKIIAVNFIDLVAPKSMSYWFYGCTNLTNIENIKNLNTSNVTNMKYLFRDCSSLTSLDLNSFDTSQVTLMDSMFMRM